MAKKVIKKTTSTPSRATVVTKKTVKQTPNKNTVTVGRLKKVTDSLKNESAKRMASAYYYDRDNFKSANKQEKEKTINKLISKSNEIDKRVNRYSDIIKKASNKK